MILCPRSNISPQSPPRTLTLQQPMDWLLLLLLLNGLLHVDLELLLQQMQCVLQLLPVQLLGLCGRRRRRLRRRRRRRLLPSATTTSASAALARLLGRGRRTIGAAERMVSHQLLQLLRREDVLLEQLLHVRTVLERLLHQQGSVGSGLRLYRIGCCCCLCRRSCDR